MESGKKCQLKKIRSGVTADDAAAASVVVVVVVVVFCGCGCGCGCC